MAGQQAAHKSICRLHKLNFCEGLSWINSLPIGEDPDDYVKNNGLKSFLDHEKILSQEDILSICQELHESEMRKKEDAKQRFHKQ